MIFSFVWHCPHGILEFLELTSIFYKVAFGIFCVCLPILPLKNESQVALSSTVLRLV